MKAKTGIITFVTIAAALGLISAQLARFTVDTSLNKWLDGANGYQLALSKQKSSNKPVALFFYTDWCENCKALRKNVLSSPEFEEFSTSLIVVKINPETGPDERKIADKYGIYGVPAFLLIRPENGVIRKIQAKRNSTPPGFIKQCRTALET